MKKSIFTPAFILATCAICIAAITRLFPHIPNFTPIAAMALFGAVKLNDKRLAIIIPMLAMLVSDVLLEIFTGWGFHNTLIYVYVAFLLTSVIGFYVRRNPGAMNLAGASVISSVLFFMITNFGYWAANGFAGGTAGLGLAYAGGLPFFAPTVLGDLFFNCVLFGSFFLIQRRFPALIKVK